MSGNAMLPAAVTGRVLGQAPIVGAGSIVLQLQRQVSLSGLSVHRQLLAPSICCHESAYIAQQSAKLLGGRKSVRSVRLASSLTATTSSTHPSLITPLSSLDARVVDADTIHDHAETVASSVRSPGNFSLVNFYHLTDLQFPHQVIRKHRDWLDGKDIMGRIYITGQGINAQFSGPVQAAHAYAEWVSEQPEFEGLRWASDPVKGHEFPRLRLKYRDNLVQLAGGTLDLPLSDPNARATPIEPAQWQEMLSRVSNAMDDAAGDNLGNAHPKPVVLDVRNSYEWDGGHFQGAERPAETQFNQTPREELPGSLRDIPKDTPIMMYCTGGIRCDVYSPVLRQQGFSNLYTLHGGIANYLRQLGPSHWKGSMFTFDNRLAVAPDGAVLSEKSLTAASGCQCCGNTAQLPHLNCANIDCNRLFLACPNCQETLRGCCSAHCLHAPRMVRPITDNGTFGPWHTLVDGANMDAATKAMRLGRMPTRVAKQQRKIERLKVKRDLLRQQRAERKALINAALDEMKTNSENAENSSEEKLLVASG